MLVQAVCFHQTLVKFVQPFLDKEQKREHDVVDQGRLSVEQTHSLGLFTIAALFRHSFVEIVPHVFGFEVLVQLRYMHWQEVVSMAFHQNRMHR
jgi:hypothetical protein